MLGDPIEVLRELLADVPGIRAAFVFGSAAKGALRPDSDIDLFILDEGADPIALGEAMLTACARIGREIDLRRYTRERFREARHRRGTGYLQRVLDGPKRWVIGSPSLLDAA